MNTCTADRAGFLFFGFEGKQKRHALGSRAYWILNQNYNQNIQLTFKGFVEET